MKRFPVLVTAALAAAIVIGVAAEAPAPKKDDSKPSPDLYSGKFFKSEESVTSGAVNGVSYGATTGTIVVHPEDWNDTAQNGGAKTPDAKGDESSAEASIFFVYYAKKGADVEKRPITSTFTGGPGSPTLGC